MLFLRHSINLIKQKLKQAHNRCIEEILSFTNSLEQSESNCQSSPEPHKSTLASKKLFSLLKNSKQDSKGIAPIKKDCKFYSDTVGKANILNQQFQSVFTPKSPLKLSRLAYMAVQDLSNSGTIDPSQIPGECLSTTPHMESTTPHKESITVSTNSITKLLTDLNPLKAAGPDQIKGLVLQSKKEGKDQEPTQSSTKPDPGYQWESDNFTIRHHKRKPRGQPFPSR